MRQPSADSTMNNAALRLRRQCKAPHASYAARAKWCGEKCSVRSERPALGVADQKIPERLHARHRLQLFRIDEERIESGSLFFAEKLHKADVLLDQIVRQQCDAQAALAGTQHAHDVV